MLGVVVGVAALAAMLLWFQDVVQEQASAGDRRRAAMTAWSDGNARCNTVAADVDREACRAAVVPVPRHNRLLNGQKTAQR